MVKRIKHIDKNQKIDDNSTTNRRSLTTNQPEDKETDMNIKTITKRSDDYSQ